MQIMIDLQASELISLEELQKTLCISSLIFSLVVDGNLQIKMARIISYIPFLSRFPSIRTTFKIQSVQSVPLVRCSTVALGGTFDYLHIGHQLLLLYGALAAKQTIYVGVTGEALLAKKKYRQALQNLTIRMKEVQDFIKMINPDLKVIVFELNNPFGPTIDHEDIQCLVTSPQTASSLIKINEIRAQNGLKDLQLVVCPLLSHNQEISSKISSSGIREYYLKKNGFKEEQLLQYKQCFFKLLADIDKCLGLKQTQETIAQKWWDNLFRKYSQYWRFYHTNQHIYQTLKEWNSEAFKNQRESLTKQQKIVVELSLFFHDIVYIPAAHNNEKASAAMAAQFIQQYLGSSSTAEEIQNMVIKLIAQTENHIPSSSLSQIVYNLDMGILNSDKGRYKDYAGKIKKEYEPLVKQKYNQKRKEFLMKTLEQKQYFSFEATNVKSNLEWEIFCLDNDDL